MIIHHDQLEFTFGMQGWFKIHNSDITHQQMKNKNCMVISTVVEKAFKIQHVHDENFEHIRYRKTYLNITKAVYSKSTVNIMLNGEKLKDF